MHQQWKQDGNDVTGSELTRRRST